VPPTTSSECKHEEEKPTSHSEQYKHSAVQISNQVTQTVDVMMPIMELLGKGSIKKFSNKVVRQSILLDRIVLEMCWKTSRAN
jgi:hypothetical protein